MPFQMDPFNGDHFIEKKFLELRDKYGIKVAIETGTCLGSTTIFLAKNFELVKTVEINPQYYAIANGIFKQKGVCVDNILGNSVDAILYWKELWPALYWLDAHWGNECPLLLELAAIRSVFIAFPVIAIHDFQVPNEPGLGFDSINGQPFTLEWIKPYLDKIYEDCENGYSTEYNTFEESAGAKRGIIYITPNL